MSFLIIIAVTMLFSVGTNISVYAQMPEGAGEQSSMADSSKDVQAEEVMPPADGSVMKIERLDSENQVYSFELKAAQISDIFRVLAYDYKLNLLVDNEVEGKITATMTNVSLEQFLDAVAESLNLTIEKNGSFIKVKPNLVTKIFILRYIEARTVLSSAENEETVKKENTIYDLLSAKGQVFLGEQPNSIMVIDYPPNIKKVEDYLKEVDYKMSSRIFKLKYLKASDVVGVENNTQADIASSSAGS
ncbi:MAG: hypothetical protein AABZ27_01205 [Candidatus Omnitrophota bacterium]